MSEYTVEKISQQPPREWDGPNGKVFYLKVMLTGYPKAVSIGKKSADALKVGDTVYGTITPDPNHEEDKFKADKMPFNGGPGKPAFIPKDEEAIVRQSALKSAVAYFAIPKTALTEDNVSILEVAETFLRWLKERPEAPKDDEPRYEQEGF